MSVFDFPTADASPEEIIAEIRRVREYLRNAPDPNETGSDGRTLLLLALTLCASAKAMGELGYDLEGEALVMDLLQRGADPNRPSAWVNFTMALSVSQSLSLMKKLIDSGLSLNEVYEVSHAQGAMTDGRSTLLDHLYGIRDYISPKRKKLNELANKYAGGLGERRR